MDGLSHFALPPLNNRSCNSIKILFNPKPPTQKKVALLCRLNGWSLRKHGLLRHLLRHRVTVIRIKQPNGRDYVTQSFSYYSLFVQLSDVMSTSPLNRYFIVALHCVSSEILFNSEGSNYLTTLYSNCELLVVILYSFTNPSSWAKLVAIPDTIDVAWNTTLP
jgi:hypothetical protein